MQASKPLNFKNKRSTLQAKKKEKKNNKATLRAVNLDSEINLISDEDSSPIQNAGSVENAGSSAKLPNPDPPLQNSDLKPNHKFNTFNYSRLTKLPVEIDLDIKVPQKSQIEIVFDDRPLNSTTEQAYKSYTFSVEGQKDQMKVRDAHLKDLASKQLASMPKMKTLDQTEKVLQAIQAKQKAFDQFQKKSRYFEISHEICYKCNKEGHYARNCIELDSRKCKICFSRLHDEHSCPQICYQCGEPGHISNDCPHSKTQRCERCRQRGHSSSFCGVILRDKERLPNLESIFSESDLKKLKCINEDKHEPTKKESHYNCFVYQDWPMPYHQLRKPHSHNNRHTTLTKHARPSLKNEEPKLTYAVDQRGYLISRNYTYQPRHNDNKRDQSRNHNHNNYQNNYNHHINHQDKHYNNYGHPQQRFNSNASRTWRNDEYDRYSRSLDERERGGKGRFDRKNRLRQEPYY